MTDTPETDHLENNLGNAAHPTLLFFCRKLERERDRLAEANHSLAVMLEDERKERDMYQYQADFFLEQWGKTQERMFKAFGSKTIKQ